MRSEVQAQFRRMLRSRSQALADAYYQVVRACARAPYPRREARRIVAKLAERATSLLCEGQISRSEAQALGAAFADFKLEPDGWGRIEESLVRELTWELPAEMVVQLQPQLCALTGSMAVGFLRETQAAILREQEHIHQAYIDVLERAERELHIKDAAIDSSVTAIALWMPDGTITYVNPAFLAMWRYDSAEEAQDTHIQDLWAEDETWPTVHSSLEQTGGWVRKLTGKRADDSLFTVLLSASVVKDMAGNPVRVMGSFVDMTYRERANQMLSERIHRLEILHRIDQAILEARFPREILEAGLRGISRLVPCQYASVTSCDFDAEEFVLEAVHSDGPSTARPGDRLPMAGFEVPIDRLRQGQEVLIDDAESYPWPPEAMQVIGRMGLRSFVAVPIRAKGAMFGYLCLSAESPGVLGRESLPVARELASSLAVAIRHAQLHQSIERQSGRLRMMMTQLAEAEEKERHRVAQLLHDRIGQNLTALGLNLNLVRSQMESLAPEAILSRLDDSLAIVEETTERTRLVMTDLRPPMLDDYGLFATLRWYGEQFSSRTGLPVTVTYEKQAEAVEPPRLPSRVEGALFRIAQEALTNAARHSRATGVSVTLASNGGVARLTITDDGTGFDPSHSRAPEQAENWGLLTMAERAEAVGGRCHVESAPGEGTRVIVEVGR